MGFQIKNKEGAGIPIIELDKQACEFWGVPMDERKYARPANTDTSWFDMIGLYIHAQRQKDRPELSCDWDEVLGLMMGYCLLNKDADGVAKSIKEYWHHFIDLIRHWKDLGYQPYAIYD